MLSFFILLFNICFANISTHTVPVNKFVCTYDIWAYNEDVVVYFSLLFSEHVFSVVWIRQKTSLHCWCLVHVDRILKQWACLRIWGQCMVFCNVFWNVRLQSINIRVCGVCELFSGNRWHWRAKKLILMLPMIGQSVICCDLKRETIIHKCVSYVPSHRI